MGTTSTLLLCRASTVATSSAASGNPGWSNSSNITLDDGVFATSTDGGGGTVTNFLKAYDFGFAIPVDSKIIGASVQVRAGSSGGVLVQITGVGIGIDDNNTGISFSQTVTSPSTGTLYTFGSVLLGYLSSAAGTFGLPLTPYNVNSPNFQARLQGLNVGGTLFIDAMWVTVLYTDSVTATSGNTQINSQTRMVGY